MSNDRARTRHDWPADVPPRHRLESLLLAADHRQLWSNRSLQGLWRSRVESGRDMLPHGPQRAPGLYARLSFSEILGETPRTIGPFRNRDERRRACHAALDCYPMSHAGATGFEIAPWAGAWIFA
jgi:hypothetical protein